MGLGEYVQCTFRRPRAHAEKTTSTFETIPDSFICRNARASAKSEPRVRLCCCGHPLLLWDGSCPRCCCSSVGRRGLVSESPVCSRAEAISRIGLVSCHAARRNAACVLYGRLSPSLLFTFPQCPLSASMSRLILKVNRLFYYYYWKGRGVTCRENEGR